MKREEMKECLIHIGCSFYKGYLADEADKVMDEYEKHIKELEAKLKDKDEAMDTCRGLIESANVMSKDAKDKLLNRIKELESENELLKSIVDDEEYKEGLSGLAKRNAELREENEKLKAQVPKWISVKDRLPSNQEIVFGLVVGTDLVTKDWAPELNERIKRTELCYYVDGDGWYSSEGYQMVVSPRMWMPLPPPPTTEESSAIEKENG